MFERLHEPRLLPIGNGRKPNGELLELKCGTTDMEAMVPAAWLRILPAVVSRGRLHPFARRG